MCEEVKERAISLIIKARKIHRRSAKVRKYVIPQPHDYDLDADHFFDMLRWDDLSPKTFTDPPILSKIADADLKDVSKEDLPRLKCHSQVCIVYLYKVTFIFYRHMD